MPLIRRPDTAPAAAAPDLAELSSASADVRWSAARRLAVDPAAQPALIARLDAETEPRVLEAIFTALARSGDAAAGDALVRCIRADDPARRTAAMDALRTSPTALAARLSALLGDADPDVRLLACDLARALPPAEAANLLCARLPLETEANVCAAAVETLAEIGDESAQPALAACAQRFAADPFLKFAITETIRRLSAKPAASRA